MVWLPGFRINIVIDPEMANLSGAQAGAAMYFPVQDQRAADTGSNVHVEDGVLAFACTTDRLGQPRHVSIVPGNGRNTQRVFCPGREGKMIPAGDLVGSDGLLRVVIDWTAEAQSTGGDACRLNSGPLEKLPAGSNDLISDAVCAGLWICSDAMQMMKLAQAIAQANLKLGTADLDAKKEHND